MVATTAPAPRAVAPPAPSTPPPSTARRLDEAVARAREGAAKLLTLSLDERVALARAMQVGYLAIAREIVHAACAAKAIPLGTPLEGEEWTLGPWFVVRQLRLLQQSLLSLKRTGNTPVGELGRTADGRLTVQVFPAGRDRRHALQRASGWMSICEHGVGRARADRLPRPASTRRSRTTAGWCWCWAPATSTESPSMDVLTKIFNEGKACVLKMNPVNAYLGPFLERALRRRHPARATSRWSMVARRRAPTWPGTPEWTRFISPGRTATYDTIVWGPPGPEREARKRDEPPRPHQAGDGRAGRRRAGARGAGSLLRRRSWPSRRRTWPAASPSTPASTATPTAWSCSPAAGPGARSSSAGCRNAFGRAADRLAYYPGARERLERFAAGRGTRIGGRAEGALPWTLIAGLDPDARCGAALPRGVVRPVIVETSVGSTDPVEFLEHGRPFRQRAALGHAGGRIGGPPQDGQGPDHRRRGGAGDRAAPLRRGDRERMVRPAVRLRRAALGRAPVVHRRRTSRAARGGCTTPRCWSTSRRR